MKQLTGTVNNLGGGEWQLVANLPPAVRNGKRHYPRKYDTVQVKVGRRKNEEEKQREEAKAKLHIWLHELEQAQCIDPGTLTVRAMCESWLRAEEAETVEPIQPATIDFYRGNLDRHVLPALGCRVASEVGSTHLTALYADKAALAKSSIKHIKATVSAAYAWAIEEGLLDDNPALTTRRRRKRAGRRPGKQEDYRTWDPTQIARAVQMAQGQLVYLPLMISGWCGLRRGEVCGLRSCDFDIDEKTLSVDRSLEQIGTALHVAPPKSDAGYRTLPMPDALAAAVDEQLKLNEGKQLRDEKWNPEGYLLVTKKGTPIKPRNLSSAWSDFCRRKKLDPIRFHDLRHSYATDLILRQHVDVRIAAALLGHADPAITLRLYTHPDDKMHKQVGIGQNRRVSAAMAEVERDSRCVRDNVVPLRRAAS